MRFRERIAKIDWKYIIIEISIIVVGILIALQVDNWKEERNTILNELKLLHELKSELLSDLKSLDDMNKRCDQVISSLGSLQMHLFKKLPYNDSLQDNAYRIVYQIRFEHRNIAFDNLKATGIDLISNDSLKYKIVELYEYDYPRHLKIIDFEASYEKYNEFYDKHRVLKYRLNNEHSNLEIDEILNPDVFHDPEFLDLVTTKMASMIIIKRHLKMLEGEIKLIDEAISKMTNGN